MAAQGVLVDQATMAMTASKFNDTSTSIQSMMSQLSSDMTGLIGSVQHFNGAARMAFDQNKALLDEAMKKASIQLTAIADAINTVMTTHAEFSRQKGVEFNQVTSSTNGNPAAGPHAR